MLFSFIGFVLLMFGCLGGQKIDTLPLTDE